MKELDEMQRDQQRLTRLDACSVSDALDQLGLTASVTGMISLGASARIAGRVLTVRLAAGSQQPGTPSRHLCTSAVDRAQPGDVIVVEQRTGVEAAGWGGILSNAARQQAVAGAIVEGLARDIDEAADIGFPLYARGATARTARGRVYEAESGGAITVGVTQVCEGDYVVIDRSGAAFIPASRLADVLAAAERIVEREARMTKAVLRGERVSQVMGASYEDMLAPVNALHE